MEAIGDLISILTVLILLVIGFVAGKIAERRHYASIRDREKFYLNVPAVTFRTLNDPRQVREARLVVGSVVISVDYYKRFLMGFRKIFGGEVRSYSPLIDRGRREAILRMKESSPGADLFLNCRLDTSSINSGRRDAVTCVEIIATGTAVTFEK